FSKSIGVIPKSTDTFSKSIDAFSKSTDIFLISTRTFSKSTDAFSKSSEVIKKSIGAFSKWGGTPTLYARQNFSPRSRLTDVACPGFLKAEVPGLHNISVYDKTNW
ncbi:MAG: hypothetical protein GY940_07465, partial [bacterium]|nr:hypothetical protein [bacterium]